MVRIDKIGSLSIIFACSVHVQYLRAAFTCRSYVQFSLAVFACTNLTLFLLLQAKTYYITMCYMFMLLFLACTNVLIWNFCCEEKNKQKMFRFGSKFLCNAYVIINSNKKNKTLIISNIFMRLYAFLLKQKNKFYRTKNK